MNYMKLVNADRLKDCLLLEGNLGHIKTLKDVERVIDFQVDRQAWTCSCEQNWRVRSRLPWRVYRCAT